MNCQNIFLVIFLIIFIITTILFLVLYLFEISKNNENNKNLKTQLEVNKTLNKKISSLSTQNIQTMKSNFNDQNENKNSDDSSLFIFGIADEFKIICPNDKYVKIKSMYTKVVDDITNTSTINDITNFVTAFPMLHNTNHVSLNTKLISDNLRLSIPYAMPNDEIVKTRVIYGNYTCIPKN